MSDVHEFECPNHHKFNSSAKIRSFCPECGERARRNYGANGGSTETGTHQEAPPDITGNETPENSGEAQKGTENSSVEDTPAKTATTQPPRKGTTRVVTVKHNPPGKTPPTPKRQQPGKKPIKAPVISQRVVTNKEKKVQHDRSTDGGSKRKRNTAWENFKSNLGL